MDTKYRIDLNRIEWTLACTYDDCRNGSSQKKENSLKVNFNLVQRIDRPIMQPHVLVQQSARKVKIGKSAKRTLIYENIISRLDRGPSIADHDLRLVGSTFDRLHRANFY